MGLGIYAYKNVKLIGEAPNWNWYESRFDWQTTVFVNSDDYFERATDLVTGGVYEYEDKFYFRAGGYVYYNGWRDDLSLLVSDDESPFYELINFSDCEGDIGPAICQKLAKDFQEYQEKADQHPDEWFREKYAEWRKAFEFASENGFVRFA